MILFTKIINYLGISQSSFNHKLDENSTSYSEKNRNLIIILFHHNIELMYCFAKSTKICENFDLKRPWVFYEKVIHLKKNLFIIHKQDKIKLIW